MRKKNRTHQFQVKDEYYDLFQRQQRMVESIYKYADLIFNDLQDDNNKHEYYRCILQAIYNRTGQRTRHPFSGIISNIIEKQGYVKMYIMNVYWRNVYVTHHVVVTIPEDKYNFELEKGDYVHFTALINQYENKLNFGIYDFELTTKFPISTCKKLETSNRSVYKKISQTDLYTFINSIEEYETRIDIYHMLMEELSSINRLNKMVPYKCYVTMIISVYYREAKEYDLYSESIKLLPYPEDINIIILAQLFVYWLTREKQIRHPGYIMKCVTHFILYNTTIPVRMNCDFKRMVKIEDAIFRPYIDWYNIIFFDSNHIDEFSEYILDSGILNEIKL